MIILKYLILISCCLAITGCGEEKKITSKDFAESNHYREYTLSNGSRIPLSDSYCASELLKAENGIEYRKCYAQVQGFVHHEIRYCPTQSETGCESKM